ncbi:unnamed protein product [marine sediment metagenome]|uniref:Uncharacterized protein n=1 Tax=marine sediment metagenome TaxID=412755 RepID=X1AYU8_9ZZZZ
MKIYEIDGKRYRLPNDLTNFQLKMYVHLINWKWAHLSQEPGFYKRIPYDALLPDELKSQSFPLYRPIKEKFLNHQQKFPFKSHKFLGHMASSQAACVNLFLPLLKDPNIAVMILGKVKTDIKKIATDFLDTGFRIEFWDEPDNLLNDHTNVSGTDADIAIAYYDYQGNLNLWLIEHKLTETEFTTCGGFKSPGRASLHACAPASAILDNRNLCYYHSGCNFRYWDITLGDASPFNANRIREYNECPFMGGMNQLWRNQLLATSLESSTSLRWPYKKGIFFCGIPSWKQFLKTFNFGISKIDWIQ